MKRFSLFYCFVFLCLFLGAQTQSPPQSSHPEQITALAQKVQQMWRIPAMAVTVVKNGKTVYEKGFGTLSLKAGSAAVNEYTLFVNASTTKAFTAALLAMMVEKGYVRWSDPVVNHLPDFQLFDPWVTQHFLVQDIMNHKLGFQAQALDEMPAMGYSRDDLYQMMRFIKPSYEFRTTYAYSNAAFIIAAKIIEKYTSMTWDEAVMNYLFHPMEMDSTRTGKNAFFEAENFASGYRLTRTANGIKRSLRNDRQETYDWLQAVSPAAFVMSNAHDMGNWLQFLLSFGVYKEHRLLLPETMEYLFTPQTICSSDSDKMLLYAQGWRVEQGVQGKLIHHTGLAGGFTSWVVLDHTDQLGISILMNQGSTTMPHYALARSIIDLYRGVSSDWIASEYDRYLHPKAVQTEKGLPTEEAVAALPNSAYTGEYYKDVFGKVVILDKGGFLWIRIKNIEAPLEHVNGNTFRFQARSENFALTFQMDETATAANAFSIDFGDDYGPFTLLSR